MQTAVAAKCWAKTRENKFATQREQVCYSGKLVSCLSCFCFSSLQYPLGPTFGIASYFLFFVTTTIALVFFVPDIKLVYLAFFLQVNFREKKMKLLYTTQYYSDISLFICTQELV